MRTYSNPYNDARGNFSISFGDKRGTFPTIPRGVADPGYLFLSMVSGSGLALVDCAKTGKKRPSGGGGRPGEGEDGGAQAGSPIWKERDQTPAFASDVNPAPL